MSADRILANFLARTLPKECTPPVRAALVTSVLKHLPPTRLPAEHETAVVTWQYPKTAALLFDRIWSPFGPVPTPDNSVGFFGGTKREIESVASAALSRVALDHQIPDLMQRMEAAMRSQVLEAMPDAPQFFELPAHAMQAILSREISTVFKRRIPCHFKSRKNVQSEYQSGETETILATLNNLNIVDEHALKWEQVLEFRNDQESRRRYRRFVHWLD
jgi:hypothetical protein